MANFDELLAKLQANDEALDELSTEDFNELIGDIHDKIDTIRDVLYRLEHDEKRFKEIAAEFSTRAKMRSKSAQDLKDWVVYCMDKHNMPFLQGELYSVKIQEREKIDTFLDEVSPEMAIFYKNFVKKKFVWDKTKIKEGFKKGDKSVENIAKIGKTKFVKFTVRK